MPSAIEQPAPSRRSDRPGLLRRILRWKSEKPVQRVLARIEKSHSLTEAELDRIERSLRDLSAAKEKEFWDMRSPAEVRSMVARSGVAGGLAVLAGLVVPSQLLFPYVAGTLIAIGGRLPVLYRRVEDALEGQAAVEIERADARRRESARSWPAGSDLPEELRPLSRKKTLYERITQKIAGAISERVLKKCVRRLELDPEQAGHLAERLAEVTTAKKRELLERRLGVELNAIAGMSIATVGLGALFGLLTGPGVIVALFASLCNAALAGVFALLKLSFTVEAAAGAELKELAQGAEGSSKLARLREEAGHRERLALDRARAICDRYADDYGLSEVERRELSELLSTVALTKEKDVWDRRVVPTLLKPLARGAGVTVLSGAAGLTTPGGSAAMFLAAIVEAVASTFMLFRKFDHALEGAAHGFCVHLRAEQTATTM